MATFPPVSAPTPDQPLWLVSRQLLGSPVASVTITGIDSSYHTLMLDLHVLKDASNGGVNLQLNGGGGGCDYVYDSVEASTILNAGSLGAASLPLAIGSSPMAASRDGRWTVWIGQNPPYDAMVIVTGGYQRSTPVLKLWEVFALWNLGGQAISSISINSETGNLAANTAFTLTGDNHQ